MVKNLLWQYKFLKYRKQVADTGKLRLVLGCSRSGTTWIADVLSRTRTPIRFIYEPLYHFRPKITLNSGADPTGTGYTSYLSGFHPLYAVYSLFSSNFNSWNSIFTSAYPHKNEIQRNDAGWKYTLVKEVHSLLATEALLKRLRCKALLIVRNPVMAADSIFNRNRNGGICITYEKNAVFNHGFLDRYIKDKKVRILKTMKEIDSFNDERLKRILNMVFAIALINKMMEKTAGTSENSILVNYDGLLADPVIHFKKLFQFMSFEWDDSIERYICFLSESAGGIHLQDPYSLKRNLAAQRNKKCSFITEKEQAVLHRYLADCELI